MDTGGLAASIWQQFVTVWNAPVPFLAAVLLITFLVWKIFGWRYAGQIEALEHRIKLKDDTIAETDRRLKEALEKKRPVQKKAESTDLAPAKAANYVAPQPQPVEPVEKIFLTKTVTPTFLMSLCADTTQAQAARATASYVGKWMEVSGRVKDVVPHSGYIGVCLRTDAEGNELPRLASVWVYFHSQRERLENLRAGDLIVASGQVEVIERSTLRLDFGELISAT